MDEVAIAVAPMVDLAAMVGGEVDGGEVDGGDDCGGDPLPKRSCKTSRQASELQMQI